MRFNKFLKLSPKILEHHVDMAATRDGFGEGLILAGEKDDNVVVLTADLSRSTQTDKFAKKFPKRFFEMGISEQNMAGVAAGFALSGKVPFITSFAVFSPGRNWDQIRVSICYSNANVKVVGSHAGFSSTGDGATAQALEDFALMRVLPNMTVLSPADSVETKKAVVASAEHTGPVYIRIMRAKTPVFTTEKTPFEIGKAYTLSEGKDITIIATGPIVYEVLIAAENLEKDGISCEIVNCPTIKPLDEETIFKSAAKTKKVVTVEEHQINGGLGGAVSEFLSQKLPTKMEIVGAKDTFGESGSYVELKNKYGIDAHHIQNVVKSMCK